MYYVYHIRRPNMSLSEGYIGVTSDVSRRKLEHWTRSENVHLKRAINKYEDIEVVALLIADRQYCYDIESKLRPESQMGWNISAGGDRPPTRLGLTKENDASVLSQSKKMRQYKDNPTEAQARYHKRISKLYSGKGNPACRPGVGQKVSEGRRDKTVYKFIHKDGTIEECSQWDLAHKYNLGRSNLSAVVNGKRKSCGGWSRHG